MKQFEILPTDVVLCAIQKDEYKYIDEWLKYNIEKIGFDKVYIMDNDNDDCIGRINKLPYLKKLIEKGIAFVEPYPIRLKPIPECYLHFYNKCNGNWIAYFDIDEFIDLKEYKNIKEFINSFIEIKTDCTQIMLPWLFYGANGQINATDDDVQKRFSEPFYQNRTTIEGKPIVKCNLGKVYEAVPHCLYGNNVKTYDSKGNFVGSNVPFVEYQHEAPYLKHYWTKSAEEWVKKAIKGCGDQFDQREKRLNQFFDINEKTTEMEKVLTKLYDKFKNK